MIKFISVVAASYAAVSLADSYPTCGDCWCIPDNGGLGTCPSWSPQTEFSSQVVGVYKSQKPTSIYTLNCNPYKDLNCQTVPAQSLLDVETAVCGFNYPTGPNNTQSCSEYSMTTYENEEAALAAGAVLNHKGSCGVCSTSQDLAVYLTEDFTAAGKICATKGLFNEQAGLNCYMDIGLTKECAKIWNYDGIYDGEVCGKICATELTDPNNGPTPACAINDCLQCDEDKAGPLFSAIGGRTRRRSGLLSEIVRDCSSIANIVHNPCTNPSCGC